MCLLRCSGRGQCDPITKECSCDPFWTENVFRRYLGDGESNCGNYKRDVLTLRSVMRFSTGFVWFGFVHQSGGCSTSSWPASCSWSSSCRSAGPSSAAAKGEQQIMHWSQTVWLQVVMRRVEVTALLCLNTLCSVCIQKEANQGEEEDQVHHSGQHGWSGEGWAQTQIQWVFMKPLLDLLLALLK